MTVDDPESAISGAWSQSPNSNCRLSSDRFPGNQRSRWLLAFLTAALLTIWVWPYYKVYDHATSILVVAAVLQLAKAETSQTALLTYGAPLRRLYARFFPAYFNDEAFTLALSSVDGRWVNLWAESDPIGSWVASGMAGGIDRELTDPLSLARGADGSYAKVCGHSGFLGRPEFPLAVDELAARPSVRPG